jgi:hypothetical protein
VHVFYYTTASFRLLHKETQDPLSEGSGKHVNTGSADSWWWIEVISFMDEYTIFSDGDLIDILISVIRKHCDATERSAYARPGSARRMADDYANLTMQLDFAAIAQLARHLRNVTAMDPADNIDILAHLMANVAIAVYKGGPRFGDKRGGLEQVNTLAFRICTEFSFSCVEVFARFRGYTIQLSDSSLHQFSTLLLFDNWDGIVKILRGSMRLSAVDSRGTEQGFSEDNHDHLIQYLEGQFSDSCLGPDLPDLDVDRLLSAESFWNLRSVADQEGWSGQVVLELIEAQLSPERHRFIAFHSSTVTGDEWKRLHDWTKRQGGYTLWTLPVELNLK